MARRIVLCPPISKGGGGNGWPPEILDITGNTVRGEDAGLDWSQKFQLSKSIEFVAGSSNSSRGLHGQNGTGSRSKTLRELLLQRDRRCVVTGVTSLSRLKACHIIPYSARNGLHNFPSDVREALVGNIGGVDGVRNGLLMTEMLNTAFDNLEVTLVPYWTGGEASEYRLFVVVPDATTTKLHGAKFPDPALFRFHFICAMVRHCRGEITHLEDLSRDEVTDLKVSGAGDGENFTDG
ncbi:hypothetical protein M427DRAFT_155461 [Gonapodya prolifera JEL478]|uniref:HNH nuclease domain-containing protein n=1 Tax=Gonapodya prolifera (strain JEL478) TaxID=1344416 RepID=A0A139AEN4_GONPJ|nr:hypothetical protein M427DRAFT_155461 [Gonapodya prolifera JEL478]|eukprot:KXS15282.1 hypothetical protein M427DRAFT_155461 [Gonapodya prolifera JEL478]